MAFMTYDLNSEGLRSFITKNDQLRPSLVSVRTSEKTSEIIPIWQTANAHSVCHVRPVDAPLSLHRYP